eukprot:CAMPEP_0185578300 /NCGR_PEP_ID=MMETSP0434-20130131/12547_1 /TAXON_ID=626734 ORGANISM="Favella taraikaensis, Strain Fe Narragansett Bay" /NCGR_SAMPLE_ID=MMETSP0434 /ASSEMBLY_ACC=CAM_ASM_000379 /LENGTH=199 /DNA_ID=CAMNT_0028196067 /DNA_START=16 /DNA_END=615 /DNA_ORIENTATION=+
MAKGARCKYKKRMRTAKAAHLYKIQGKARLERLNSRINDPNYQMQSEYTLGPNAFLEPDNPCAVFPQVKKPEILDMRSHKIEGGGLAAIGTFRKHLSKTAKRSKYEVVVRTAEQIEREEQEAAGIQQMVDEQEVEQQKPVVASAVATKEAMDELAMLTEKMSLEKKQRRRKAKDDEDMDGNSAPKIQIKSKPIQKTKKD